VIYWDFYGIFDDDLNGKWIVYSLDSSLWRVVSRETPKPTCAIWFWHVFTSEAKKKGQRRSKQPECAGCYCPSPDIIFAYVCIAKLRHSAKIAAWCLILWQKIARD